MKESRLTFVQAASQNVVVPFRLHQSFLKYISPSEGSQEATLYRLVEQKNRYDFNEKNAVAITIELDLNVSYLTQVKEVT